MPQPAMTVVYTNFNDDKRSFAERMADPQTPQDKHVVFNYRQSIENAGRSWAAELAALQRKAEQRDATH